MILKFLLVLGKEKPEPKPDNMGAIIGGAVSGGVLVLIIIIVITVIFIRWRKNKHQGKCNLVW